IAADGGGLQLKEAVSDAQRSAFDHLGRLVCRGDQKRLSQHVTQLIDVGPEIQLRGTNAIGRCRIGDRQCSGRGLAQYLPFEGERGNGAIVENTEKIDLQLNTASAHAVPDTAYRGHAGKTTGMQSREIALQGLVNGPL